MRKLWFLLALLLVGTSAASPQTSYKTNGGKCFNLFWCNDTLLLTTTDAGNVYRSFLVQSAGTNMAIVDYATSTTLMETTDLSLTRTVSQVVNGTDTYDHKPATWTYYSTRGTFEDGHGSLNITQVDDYRYGCRGGRDFWRLRAPVLRRSRRECRVFLAHYALGLRAAGRGEGRCAAIEISARGHMLLQARHSRLKTT